MDWLTGLTEESYMALIALVAVAVGFTGFYFTADAIGCQKWFTRRYPESSAVIWRVFFQKSAGFVWLGCFPALLWLWFTPAGLAEVGVRPEVHRLTLLWASVLGAIFVLMNLLFVPRLRIWRIYPEMRVEQWSLGLFMLNIAGWAMYLLAYEFLFRGVLLWGCMHSMDPVTAIAVSTVIYIVAHIPKGLLETLLSFPMGILMCLITLQTGTIWAAFVAHIALSVSSDAVSIYANPKMQFKLIRRS